MSNENKGLVPKLRFPEFRDAREWKSEILGNLSTVVRGGSPRPIDDFITTSYSGLNWLKIGDVDKEAKYVTKTQEKVHPEALSKTREVHSGDLILSNSMSFGRPYLLKIRTCIHDGWIAITDVTSEASREYLYYLIFSPSSQSYFLDNAAGSGVLNLNAEIIKALPVAYPSQSEQQKIADCLSSLDELIAAQTEKIDALKTHKKGLMQQLFPREGETVPRSRFPEFKDGGEWSLHELGTKTSKVGSGVTPNGGEKVYCQTGRPFVRSQNVGWGQLLLDDVAFINEETHQSFIGTEIANLDVLLNITGASIGRSAVADSRIVGGNVNQHVCIIRTKDELNPTFLNQFLISHHGQSQIDSFQAGGNRQGLNFAQIRSFSIPLPPDKGEQQKIADCLSSLDELITAEADKLDALKMHKKGLMQQLFPALNEVEA